MFADDLLIIDRLRNEAIHVQEPHVSGISRLVTYAAQLKWLGGKFPVDVSNRSIAVGELTTKPLLTRESTDWSRVSMVPCVWFQYLKTEYVKSNSVTSIVANEYKSRRTIFDLNLPISSLTW
ncbi:unnamed protein product [Aspergillus oryzae]|uniref:Unnamed protein product n=2 Tax=Aspergillus oryzae TaxID=5062 RepID=A0AAN4YYK5_ASPOZ|nr:unnamed protein product [Aspergillus oryzae]GMF84206.1 unnamed protein product [Aspergillus oryzae]GMG36233.1 unnamed protein product [Aspergillus oryzae]GMG54785.1 unnamed protein product [Aspergillus oryzae var. brunneus]